MNEVILPKRNVKIFSRETFSRKTNKTITMLVLTLGGMIIILSAVFVSMTSATSQKGYELRQLQLENEQLQIENEKLRSEVTDSRSFKSVEDAGNVKDMTPPDMKEYVTSKKSQIKK